MDTNSVAMVIQNHETHDTKIEQRVIEPLMDTNGHECRAQGDSEPRMDTNGHERTLMDTNVVAMVVLPSAILGNWVPPGTIMPPVKWGSIE